MGRPERPIVGSGPAADLARDLRRVRREAGITYDKLARDAHFSKSVLSCAANGRSPLPAWSLTWAYACACGVSPTLKAEWRDKWEAAKADMAIRESDATT